MSVLPDCLRCGVCCFSELDTYVSVTGDDHARLGADAERLTRWVGNRCYMAMDAGRCAALELRPDTGELRCAVYERRPTVCRELARGGPACEAERLRKEARPRRALAALRG